MLHSIGGQTVPKQKRKEADDDVFATQMIDVPRFGSGQVAEILGVELWQLNRFLSRYELTSSGQLGEGRGSRRLYTTEDVYRIRAAMFLIRDGFAQKLVAQIMPRLEDEDFQGRHDSEGEFREFGIALSRSKKGPAVNLFRADAPPKIDPDSDTYYALRLSTITQIVDRRIAELKIVG